MGWMNPRDRAFAAETLPALTGKAWLRNPECNPLQTGRW
jgi:hypothetical protein